MLGFASSDAHPGGNVTGFILHPAELSAKRLELLHAAFPDAAVVTALLNSAENLEEVYRATVEAGASHGLTIHRVEVDGPEALRMLRQDSFYPRAPLLVLPGAMFWNHRSEIIALAAAAHVPALYPEREYADDGGLIAYGANVPDNFRRAADYVDRILKGARPGDLPIQSPTKFDFIINLRTAKALGLTLPPSFLIRADEVIE